MLHKVGVVCYVLSVLAGLGLAARLVGALIRWDFSPWWIWLGGLAAIVVLQMLAAGLMEKGR
jgi:hypothetical protein